PAGDDRVARADRARLAGCEVEGIRRSVTWMVDAVRPATAVEREVGADGGPQAAIFFGAQADLPDGVIRTRHIFGVDHALPTRQRGPERVRADVTPAGSIEVHVPLARSERDPRGTW